MVPPSTTQQVQLGGSAGGTAQTPCGSSILSWDPSCEQQPSLQPLLTRSGLSRSVRPRAISSPPLLVPPGLKDGQCCRSLAEGLA